MKRQGSTELPRFAVGALAIAGASAANGATVQIAFGNNVVSLSSGATNFVADLTGDLINDVYGGAGGTIALVSQLANVAMAIPRVNLGKATNSSGDVLLGPTQWIASTARALVPFSFSDSRINNSLVTSGFLDLEGNVTVGGNASMKIHRLIFDDTNAAAPVVALDATYATFAPVSAVPEASTSLGLLALGAGGLLTRRRTKRAAEAVAWFHRFLKEAVAWPPLLMGRRADYRLFVFPTARRGERSVPAP